MQKTSCVPVSMSQWQDHGDAAISVITASELLVGVHRADTEQRRQNPSAFVEAILSQIPIFDFTIEVARIHAELFALLTARGGLVGPHDLIIAATARHHASAVLTTNAADFARGPGLEVVECRL